MSKTNNKRRYRSSRTGKLNIVGIGPGDLSCLTQKARQVLRGSQVIVGYRTYIALLGNLTKGKEVVSSGMSEEIKRAQAAIDKARDGKSVSIVSSGDPGIYGMAGLVLELLKKEDIDALRVEVIPGVPAVASCASLLGAPLMHDFACISLSDLLTDKSIIKKRLALAARGNFVIALYNPKSRKRKALLNQAWRILMKYRSGSTPVGIVRNAYRDNQEIQSIALKDLPSSGLIDMFSTIIIGNSQTYRKAEFMITPRGYLLAHENKNLKK